MRTIEADKLAVRATLTLLTAVTTDDLSRPTPCTAWDLGALLTHMTTQHRGFAAAAAGHGDDPTAWQPTATPDAVGSHAVGRQAVGIHAAGSHAIAGHAVPSHAIAGQPTASQPVPSQPTASQPGPSQPGPSQAITSYTEAAELVIAAFAEPGVLDRVFVLPEVAGDRPIPGEVAVGFHLVDYVVHGWDVARTLGLPFEPPDEVLAAALPVARAVPSGERRLEPGAAFGPALTFADGSDPLTEIIARLGRSPEWTAG